MKNIEREFLRRFPPLIRELLGEEAAVRLPGEGLALGLDSELDAEVRWGQMCLWICLKDKATTAIVDNVTRRLSKTEAKRGGGVGVLVVPYMGAAGREAAASRGLSWLDLAGNADVRGPGLRLWVQGRPNPFSGPGRPSTLFSPKASRLSRILLMRPERWWLQQELAEEAGLSPGFVSKLTQRMDAERLLQRREDDRALRPRDPSLLLEAWGRESDFSRHELLRCHAIGRTGPRVFRALSERLNQVKGLRWASTGLSGAWQRTRFADFRLSTVFVEEPPPLDRLGLEEVAEGENVWLICPKDEGVFAGRALVDGAWCVHPVQNWIDLLAHPERAEEAAEQLRSTFMSAWGAEGGSERG